ncbi:MAG: acyl-CoA dehydrogenase family protein [Pseudomonadota bacterium]
MAHFRPRAELATHEVVNQPPPFENVNLFSSDRALQDAVAKNGGGAHSKHLTAFGADVGAAQTIDWSRLANKNPPQLVSFDRYGQRLDEVEFHPAYHELMRLGLEAGVAGAAWRESQAGHVLHAALLYLMGEADGGVCCPMSMTYAVTPALRAEPAVAAEWEPRVTALRYDQRFLPPAEKNAATMGMAMTEKQGGSDIRANQTTARPIGGDEFELTGHKWFCSAPMSDAFLTLARTDSGITCFLVPRWRPDGTRNAFHIMRLKDKMGDRSNASSEIEYHGAWARRVGEEGRGVKTIIEMVMHTRLDCIVGSAAGMRAALAQAIWHAQHRTAFQKKLIDQPAMQGVLADLAIETEAATALAFRIARSFDARADDPQEAAFARLATPIAKFWVCKRQPGVVYEALECLGGAGFIEEGPMAKLFRASPLNAIWEGSGNVIALDVLRAMAREPEAVDAVRAELANAKGADPRLDRQIAALDDWFKPGRLSEASARGFCEEAALALAGAALAKTAPGATLSAFCESRLDRDARALGLGGAIRDEAKARAIIERAAPA